MTGHVLHFKPKALRCDLVRDGLDLNRPSRSEQKVPKPGEFGRKADLGDRIQVSKDPGAGHLHQEIVVAGVIFMVVRVDDALDRPFCSQSN